MRSGRGSTGTPLVFACFFLLTPFLGGASGGAPFAASAASSCAGMPLSRVSSSPLRVEYGRPWSVPKLYFVLVCHSQRLDMAKQLDARPYF